MTVTAINPQAFAKLCNERKKIDLIDVRTPVEFREVHVEIARNVPVNIEGGTMACVESGLPVVRGKKAISLERQVRIAAGLMIVTASALGYFVHPA